MTTDYTIIAEGVDEVLADLGQSVTITKKASGAYNTSTATASVTTTTETGRGVAFAYDTGKSLAPGKTILAGDQRLLLSAIGITEPKPGEVAALGSVAWQIVAVDTVAPAGVAVLYDCQIRK